MASPVPPTVDHGGPRPLRTLSEELLEEIFLRLPSPTDLARACTACASFRRIITDRSFLRRFRAMHPPPVLGFPTSDGLHPAEPPHPSAPLARALADAADFTYSFVPKAQCLEPWFPRDVRQGRVLLGSVPIEEVDIVLSDLELAVCDPLYRQYILLPPIPNDLIPEHRSLVDFGAFLARTCEDEETSFRVVCPARNENKLFAFVFSSSTGQWLMAACVEAPPSKYGLCCCNYARGCLYFTVPWRDKLLVLDALRMEFSIINNVPFHYGSEHDQPSVVESAEGSLMMVFLSNGNEDGSTDLLRITKLDESEPCGRWHLEKTIPLPTQHRYFTLGAAEGVLFLGGPRGGFRNYECLAVDINTCKFQRVCGIRHSFHLHPYFGFPPSLSKPCI